MLTINKEFVFALLSAFQCYSMLFKTDGVHSFMMSKLTPKSFLKLTYFNLNFIDILTAHKCDETAFTSCCWYVSFVGVLSLNDT